MPGIYLHIPFCKQSCHYCDFHFSTSLKNKDAMLKALQREVEARKNYLGSSKLDTIYFGGGTPSLLNREDLELLFETVYSHFEVAENAEITLEANPDDLTDEVIASLAKSPINRLSIGVQSFLEDDLRTMNRAHNSNEALRSIKASQDVGFENITIDLIYGLPDRSLDEWARNLQQAFNLNVQHLSAYCLSLEEGTALSHFIKKGKVIPVSESAAIEQFDLLLDEVEKHGWEQYEISNFCRDEFYSQHNSSYWKGETYLGIGPSAHSFDGQSRQWNVSHNRRYIDGIVQGNPSFECEQIEKKTAFNEYVLTGLRTKWGCDLKRIEGQFGADFLQHFNDTAAVYFDSGDLMMQNKEAILSKSGKRIADRITSDLFIID